MWTCGIYCIHICTNHTSSSKYLLLPQISLSSAQGFQTEHSIGSLELYHGPSPTAKKDNKIPIIIELFIRSQAVFIWFQIIKILVWILYFVPSFSLHSNNSEIAKMTYPNINRITWSWCFLKPWRSGGCFTKTKIKFMLDLTMEGHLYHWLLSQSWSLDNVFSFNDEL